MPRKTILIQRPAKISVKHAGLVIEQGESKARVPLEDIWVLIIESQQAIMTASSLSSLAGSGIGVMVCDGAHMPNGLLLPIGAHSRHAAIVENQLAISKPLKKRLWQRVVQAKIANQAAALDLLGKDSATVRKWYSRVKSGDSGGAEAAAAGAYFRELMPAGATRRDGSFAAPLDFGYAVLRAGIAREAVSGGWLVSRGIHHASALNAFNLVDDLIEPFRPIIDLIVMEKDIESPLDPTNKVELTRVFEYLVRVDGRNYCVQTAIEIMLDSLKEAVLSNDAALLRLPELRPLALISIE